MELALVYGEAIALRFWEKVKIGDGCWEWAGAKVSKGYGNFWVGPQRNSPPKSAHRVAWELVYGNIPANKPNVLHHCDNPPCVRPSHLFVGTVADNSRDMIIKGRDRHLRGEACHSANFTAEDVHVIKARLAAGETQAAIARSLGVPTQYIIWIARGKTWKHVQ